MIDLLRNAFLLLDEQGREEVTHFVFNRQNPDGGFQDRGGRSDLYYSLFGMMLLKAGAWSMGHGAKMPELAEGSVQSQYSVYKESDEPFPEPVEGNPHLENRLKHFVTNQSASKIPGFIEQCCLVLLQKELKVSQFSRLRTLIKLSRSFWKERQSINLSYRSFVLFLTLDAVLPFRGFLKIASKRMLTQTTVDTNSPCSEVAAKVFLQKMTNRDGVKDQELLKSFACELGGFRAFLHLQQADMLSTAVALFALNYAESDLRLLKPACLDFIQQNFADGAFLSGDGDSTTDLEYTFYGLLALGVLAARYDD